MGGTSAKLDDSQMLMRGSNKPRKSIKTANGGDILQHVNHAGGGGGGVVTAGKSKRKSSVMKFAETTQLVSRFSRARSGVSGSAHDATAAQQHLSQMQHLIFKRQQQHSNGSNQHMQHGSMGGGGGGGGMIVGSSGRAPSKFKTGGIVVTAVQQSTVNPAGNGGLSRRVRHSGGLHIKSGSSGLNVGAGNMLQYRNSNLMQSNKSAGGISLDAVSLVRKVKTKLKKRKSRTMANAASGAGSK